MATMAIYDDNDEAMNMGVAMDGLIMMVTRKRGQLQW